MMSNDKPIDSAKATWQSQRVEAPSMHYLRMQVLAHAQYGHNRGILEYLGAGAGVVIGIWLVATAESMLLRVGILVLMAGGLYWLYEWRRRRLMWTATLDGTAEDALRFYKQELARLRDMHRRLGKAHLVASVPGALVLTAWVLLEPPVIGLDHWWHVVFVPLAVAAWIGSMVWHEAEKANRYQRELEALEQNVN
jgi:Flp pilus assembly protein TadB